MKVAILNKSSICSTSIIVETLETAQEFLELGLFSAYDAKAVTELPEGYGVGDYFDGETWHHKEVDTPPSIEDLAAENKLLKAQIQAQTERSDFIEDCIAEMATQVYGGV